MERNVGIEPTTGCLEGSDSTNELIPHIWSRKGRSFTARPIARHPCKLIRGILPPFRINSRQTQSWIPSPFG